MKHPLSTMKVAVLGYGNLGRTLAQGLSPVVQSVVATERAEKTNGSQGRRAVDGISILHDNAQAVLGSDVVFLCVKPKDMEVLLQEIGRSCKGKLVVSTAAGVPLSYLAERLPGARIARTMPNLCASIGESNTAVAFSSGLDEGDQAAVLALLSKLGRVQKVEEKQMAVWTAVNGSGPAFLALVLDEMAQALARRGFGEDEALAIATHTLLSTGRLLAESGEKPGAFIRRVASPGGTTELGLRAGGEETKTAFASMLEAASARAEEMERARS